MKTIAIAMLALILISAVAYAEEVTADDPVDDETAGQIRAMANSHGASMRLLQLERSIERNILFGEKVIEAIEANYSSYDTTDLRSLLDELSVLKDEVAAVDPEGETNEVVQQFVDLKSDARDITKDFRTAVHEFMEENDIENLRSRIGGDVGALMNQYKERVKAVIRNHNAEIVKKRLQNMNQENEQLIQKALKGEVNPQEIKAEFRNILEQMGPEAKKNAVSQVVNTMTSLSVRSRAAIQDAKEGYMERLQERVRERLESAGINVTAAAEKLQERVNAYQAQRGGADA